MRKSTHRPSSTSLLDPSQLDANAHRRLEAIGREMRRIRGDRTQQELGQIIGDIPQTTISRWEAGQVDLSISRIHEIEERLGLDDGHLLRAGGYVSGAEMPGTPIGRLSTDFVDSVKSLLEVAELMSWGIRIVNRVGDRDVVEFEVLLHDQVAGGTGT